MLKNRVEQASNTYCPEPAAFHEQSGSHATFLLVNEKNTNAEEVKNRLFDMLRSDNEKLIGSKGVVELLTKINYGNKLKEVVTGLNEYIFQLNPEDLITILKFFPQKKDKLIVLEGLRDTLSEVSENLKNSILTLFPCNKNNVQQILQTLTVRSCVTGKLDKNVLFVILKSKSQMTSIPNFPVNRGAVIEKGILEALNNLPADSKFNIVLYNEEVKELSENFLPANASNKRQGEGFINGGLYLQTANNIQSAIAKATSYKSEKDYTVYFYFDDEPVTGFNDTNVIVNNLINLNNFRKNDGLNPVKFNVIYADKLGVFNKNEKQITSSFYLALNFAKETGGRFRRFVKVK